MYFHLKVNGFMTYVNTENAKSKMVQFTLWVESKMNKFRKIATK